MSLTVGVVGKGGVGKTTIAGLIARTYVERGACVIAIDTDSNPNLGLSLGLSLAETEAVPVLPRSMLVGSSGTTAEDLVSEYGRSTPAGPTLLSAIRVTEAGAGCTCGGHATVRGMLGDALADVDVTLVDMEAGLEHLSRSGGTLAYADVLVMVCEPTRKSVLTAERTRDLADELGIPHVVAVGNKSCGPEDVDFFESAFTSNGLTLAAVVPYDMSVASADRAGTGAVETVPPMLGSAIAGLLDQLDRAIASSRSLTH